MDWHAESLSLRPLGIWNLSILYKIYDHDPVQSGCTLLIETVRYTLAPDQGLVVLS